MDYILKFIESVTVCYSKVFLMHIYIYFIRMAIFFPCQLEYCSNFSHMKYQLVNIEEIIEFEKSALQKTHSKSLFSKE